MFNHFAVIGIGIPDFPYSLCRNLFKDTGISEVNSQTGDIVVVDPEVKGQAVIPGQAGNGHTGGGAAGQRHGLAECPAVHVICRAVLGIEGPVETGAVSVIAVKVLKAQGIRVIRDQLIIGHVIVQVQTGHFGGREGGAVAAVLQLVVVDVGHVPDFLIVIVGGVISIVDGDEGWGVLDVYQIILVCTVVNGDIIAAVILVVVEIILGVVVLVKSGVIVIVGRVIVVPGFEVRTVGIFITDVVGGVLVEEVRELDVGLIVICGGVVCGVVDGVKGLVVAVDDFRVGSVAAAVIVRYITGTIYYTAGTSSVIILRLG